MVAVISCRPAADKPDDDSTPNVMDNIHQGGADLSSSEGQGSQWSDLDDPSSDGWHTEVLAGRADKQLKHLKELLLTNEIPSAEKVQPFLAADFICDPLLPASLSTAYESGAVHIQRDASLTNEDEQQANAAPPSLVGPEGFSTALATLMKHFSGGSDLHAKFKTIGITEGKLGFTTEHLFAFWGRTATGMAEQHSNWVIKWKDRGKHQPPLMRSVRISNRELTETNHSSGPLFVDCTEAAIGGNECYSELRHGVNDWLERSQQRRYFFSLGTPGMAIGDINGDGLEDVYLCQEEGTPNRLFLHQADGTVVEAAKAWNVDWIHDSRSALFFDWDNDGDQDLIVGTLGGVIVAENEQNKQFTYRTMLRTSQDVMSLAAADYDNDGDVDFYVCGYYKDQAFQSGRTAMPAASGGFVYHDANNGAKNTLFQNDGSGEFKDVTDESGMGHNNQRFSFAASWDDYDNDGDVDLYVANDYGRDSLYRNDNGKFVDFADEANIENSAGGMGVTWADYDRNGSMDVYISNMWSSAGKRIAFQEQFKSDAPEEVKNRIQRSARGNTLLQGQGDGTFKHVSAEAAVEVGRWAWSSKFVDLNNDGWDDILVANGMVTGSDTGDL